MSTNLIGGFDLVFRELDEIIKAYHDKGIHLYSESNFIEAEKQAQRIQELEKIKDHLQKIDGDLRMILSPYEDQVNEKTREQRRRTFDILPKGVRTPEREFRIPILMALQKLGGSGHIKEVMAIVASIMGEKLNKYDLEPIKSTPNFPRWRNTAQWERDSMVKEGLLTKGTPRSIWSISEKGENYLANITDSSYNDSSDEMPKNLEYVLEVYKQMKSGIGSFEKACVRVGAINEHLNPSVIKENCTDYMEITKDEFISLLGNQEGFVELLSNRFPNHTKAILDRIRKI